MKLSAWFGRTRQWITGVVKLVLGVAVACWSASVLPIGFRASALNRVAEHVVAGDRFTRQTLESFENVPDQQSAGQSCNPTLIRALGVVRLRLLELDFQDGQQGETIDSRIDSLRHTVRRALACSPANPFFWVLLYWSKIQRNGFDAQDVNYLKLSYVTGPNEGWVALRRNPLALAIFDYLPSSMRGMVTSEFANLVGSGFEKEAATLLTGPGWKYRNLLLSRLEGTRQSYRYDFARELYREGYDVTVPGVKLPDPRPWD